MVVAAEPRLHMPPGDRSSPPPTPTLKLIPQVTQKCAELRQRLRWPSFYTTITGPAVDKSLSVVATFSEEDAEAKEMRRKNKIHLVICRETENNPTECLVDK